MSPRAPHCLLLGLVLAGCAATIPPAEPRQLAAFRPEEAVTLADLREGRRLYVAKCGGCHGLYSPLHGPEARWREWLRDMEPRARLDDEASRKILVYLRGAAHELAAAPED